MPRLQPTFPMVPTRFRAACTLAGAWTLAWLQACSGSPSSGGGPDARPGPSEPTFRPVDVRVDERARVDLTPLLAITTVDADGGTVLLADPTHPEGSFSIEIPPGAVPVGEVVTFEVVQVPVQEVQGLPEYAEALPVAWRIEASGSEGWNQMRMFDVPVRVTLPVPPWDGVLGFYVPTPDGGLEAAGLDRWDREAGTLSFYTRAFADAGVLPEGWAVEAAPPVGPPGEEGSGLQTGEQGLRLPQGFHEAAASGVPREPGRPDGHPGVGAECQRRGPLRA